MASENSEKILNYLKKNYGVEMSKQQIAADLGLSVPTVTGTINALIKKKYAETTRKETVEDSPATETRKAKTKVVKYHTLTEEGLAYDPIAEEAEKAAAKQAEKERKAAEKAAAKAAKEAEASLEKDIRKFVTEDDKLVKAIIDDFDALDAIALAIFKKLA